MRRLLISAAALALLATPALFAPASAQEGHRDRDQGNAPAAPAAAPAAPAPRTAPAGQQRVPGQGHRENFQPGNRGGNGGPTSFTNGMPGSPASPQVAAPQNRGDQNRGNQNRGDRGQGRGDRGNGFAPGRDNNPGFNRPDNRPGNGFDNRRPDDRRGAGNPGYGGPRHDFSNFRDFHRDFRASRRFRGPDYRRPAGWYDHRWAFGEFLPTAFWARDYWLSDYNDYDLPPPPYGATWVRVGNDALLVDEDSGEVITVEYDVFY
jgi:Ni/Co efflux regulator RcnB